MQKLFKKIACCVTVLLWLNAANAQRVDVSELNKDVVQLYGVLRSEDNIPLRQASVFVEGTKRGTLTNEKGIYSIVVNKGDRIRFSFIGFKDAIVTVPHNIISETYNIDYKMVEDTALLPTTFVKSLPSAAKFERDFVALNVDMSDYDLAQYNVRKEILDAMVRTSPIDGVEASSRQALNNVPGRTVVNGQSQPVNILRPSSWRSLLKDWKELGSSQN